MVRSCPSCGSGLERDMPCAACAARAAGGVLPPRYQAIRPLGRGGMATVVLCRDTELGVEVAVKCLPPELARDTKAAEQLRREGNAAARLRGSPGVLSVFDLTEHAGAWILVMEYAPGGSLRERLRKAGPLPEDECRRIGEEIVDGLAAAHRAGVLHRDIKPENVLFDEKGHAKIADFGIARILAETSAKRTQVSAHGTPAYMAPELFLTGGADPRADVYALGATLYEMATGRPPFDGTYAAAANRALRKEPAPDPRDVRPELSPAFAAFVRALLEPDPALRPADAGVCAAMLRGEAVPPPPAARRRTLRLAGLAAAAVVVLAAAAAVMAALARDPPPAAPPPRPVVADVAPQLPPEAAPPEEQGAAPVQHPAPVSAAATASFLVFSEPPGATVYVDGRARGTAGREGLVVADLDPDAPHAVRGMLDGYTAHALSGVTAAAHTRTELRLRLSRLTGTMRLDGGPPGAAVWIAHGADPQQELVLAKDGTLGPLVLPLGEYDVTVSRPGFDARLQRVRIENGRTAFVDAKLKQRMGILGRVVTEPPGAQVFDGDTLLGTTPLEAMPLAAGHHVIRLVHPFADPDMREVVVVPDQIAPVAAATLVVYGTIDLTGLEKGVVASLNTKDPVSGNVRALPGRVPVFLSKDKFQDQVVEVDVVAGATVTPKPGEWKSTMATITVGSLGMGQARLNGHSGSGPWKVVPGTYVVTITRAGFKDQTQTVIAVAGTSYVVNALTWVPVDRGRTR